jgi:hypothetical protein
MSRSEPQAPLFRAFAARSSASARQVPNGARMRSASRRSIARCPAAVSPWARCMKSLSRRRMGPAPRSRRCLRSAFSRTGRDLWSGACTAAICSRRLWRGSACNPHRVIYCETCKKCRRAAGDGRRVPAWRPRGRGGRACTIAPDAVVPVATGGGSLRRDCLRFAALGQHIGRSQSLPSKQCEYTDDFAGLTVWRRGSPRHCSASLHNF